MSSCLAILGVQSGAINKHTQHVPSAITKLLSKEQFDHVIAVRNFLADLDPVIAHTVDDKAVFSTLGVSITPEIIGYLRKEHVDLLTLVGIDTEKAVLVSVLTALENHFKVRVYAPCCGSTKGEGLHSCAINIIEEWIGDENVVLSSCLEE